MSTRDPRTALIVHAHPEPASFSTAQCMAAARVLSEDGYAVDLLDLYAEGWAPVLGDGEFPSARRPFKPQAEQLRAIRDGTLDERVASQLDRLLAADLLVLSFPMWWFSMPAVLKGWVDRVFVMGGLFGGDYGLFDEAALTGRRAALLLTTGSSREAFRAGGTLGPMDGFLFHIRHGMLEFVGYRVLDPVITYGPAHLDEADRAAALEDVRAAFAHIATEPQPISR